MKVLIMGRWWSERPELTAEKLYTNGIVQSCFSKSRLLQKAVGRHPAKLGRNSGEHVLFPFTSPASRLDHWPPWNFLSLVSSMHNTHLGTQSHRGPIPEIDHGPEGSQWVVDTGSVLAWSFVGQHRPWREEKGRPAALVRRLGSDHPGKDRSSDLWTSCSFQCLDLLHSVNLTSAW